MTGEDKQFIIDQNSSDFNAVQRAKELDIELEKRFDKYLTDDILVIFGDDFKYYNAPWAYNNLDNIINYMNKNYKHKYIFKYSTPSDYIDALSKHNIQWPTK